MSTAQELKRAAMRELFTRGLRGEPQKETEIGPVPESWVEVAFSGLGEIVTGTTPPTKDRAFYDDGTIPFISPGDIDHGFPVVYTQKRITDAGLAVSRGLPSGTTCVVCIGSTIGKVGRTTAEVSATNQQINAIIPGPGYDSNYLSHLLAYHSDIVRNAASPSPVPILSKGAFEKLVLFTSTNPDEQTEIATILDAIDRKIDLHRQKRAVLEELFKALLHKLMTGEIRVADLDLSALEPPHEPQVAA
jgi:type I restriction enzyme S subunit